MTQRRLLQAFLRRYARRQARDVAPFVVGRRALDLGAGEGRIAAELRDARRWTCAVDVGAFRQAPGPYVIYDGRRLPFRDGAFDTTLLLLTLHHCESPDAVLAEAVRVTSTRLLVSESVYRTAAERFWLDLLDDRLNRYRHGGRMPPALHFARPEEWARRFTRAGLRVARTVRLGTRLERLVHHPYLFVLDTRDR